MVELYLAFISCVGYVLSLMYQNKLLEFAIEMFKWFFMFILFACIWVLIYFGTLAVLNFIETHIPDIKCIEDA